jgi:hypothetical protein
VHELRLATIVHNCHLSVTAGIRLSQTYSIAKPDFSREIPDFSPILFLVSSLGFRVLGFFIRVQGLEKNPVFLDKNKVSIHLQ